MEYVEYIRLVFVLTATYKMAKGMIKWPEDLRGPKNEGKRQYLRKKAKNCRLEGKTLYYKVPESEIRAPLGPDDDGFREVFVDIEGGRTRWDIISDFHDDGENGAHLGRDATSYEVFKHYYWKGMKGDIITYIKTCEECQRLKYQRNIPKPPLKPILAQRPLERIEIDFTSFSHPDPITGDRYMLTVVDCYSKYCWVQTFKSKHAAPVAKFLFEQIYCKEGNVEIVQCDNGSEFIAKVVQEFFKLVDADNRRSCPKHPQTNGQIERLNGTFKQLLKNMTKGKPGAEWSALVQVAMRKYNEKYHASIRRSPFEVFRPNIAFNLSDKSEKEQADFLAKLNRLTQKASLASAMKSVRQYERKYRVRVYSIGEPVLIDKGKRTRVGKKIFKLPAVIETGIAGGYYQVYWLEGPDAGQSEYVDVDCIEQFALREDSPHWPIIEDIKSGRKVIEAIPSPLEKKQKKKATKKSANVPKPKKNCTKSEPGPTKKVEMNSNSNRSQTHQWAQICAGAVALPPRRKKITL